MRITSALGLIGLLAATRPLGAQADSLVRLRNDSISIHFVDVELRAAVQALGRFLDRPLIMGNVNNVRVTMETPRPVPRTAVPRLLRGLLESQQVALVADSAAGIYRLEPRDQRAGLISPATAQPVPQSATELFVIRLRHARAADVAATVNALYGRASALGELGAAPATLARDLQAQQVPPGYPVPVTSAGAPLVAARGAALTGEVTIVPDGRANSLLVRAGRADFALIEAAVRELDVRPLQVLIEVLIAELRRDRSFEFGVGASLPPTKVRGVGGGEDFTATATTSGSGVSDFVLKVMGIGGATGLNIEATLRAAAARGDARIISRPILLAANNEAAEISVGSQRPFVQIARVLPTDNTARDQVVQYKDVGTRLHVVPTISSDGYVMLSVTQEVNAATAEQAFDAPVISTRAVSTRLLVRDGQTIVLGGLSDRQREATQGGIPILSSIPLIGGIFGHAGRRSTETELFLFLTPRVIRSDAQVDSLTNPLRGRARRIEP